jgi:hypothetical protein
MRRTAAALTALAIAAAGVVAAVQSGAPTRNVIHACVNRNSGVVRVDDSCRRSERALAWNKKGQRGARGPAGPAGGRFGGTAAKPRAFAPGNGTNWADGPNALGHVTTGTQSTGFGPSAFGAQTTQQNNTGVGYGAGGTSTGNGNTAIGTAAMYSAGSGDFNVALGLHAGRYISTGVGNTLLGTDSGADDAQPLTSGSRNTAIGYRAAQGLTTGSQPSDSVALGYAATFFYSNSVAIGASARTFHTNAVALGAGTATNAANQVNVGPRDVEVTDATKGVVLRSPNGSRFRITVGDDGSLTTTPVP